MHSVCMQKLNKKARGDEKQTGILNLKKSYTQLWSKYKNEKLF